MATDGETTTTRRQAGQHAGYQIPVILILLVLGCAYEVLNGGKNLMKMSTEMMLPSPLSSSTVARRETAISQKIKDLNEDSYDEEKSEEVIDEKDEKRETEEDSEAEESKEEREGETEETVEDQGTESLEKKDEEEEEEEENRGVEDSKQEEEKTRTPKEIDMKALNRLGKSLTQFRTVSSQKANMGGKSSAKGMKEAESSEGNNESNGDNADGGEETNDEKAGTGTAEVPPATGESNKAKEGRKIDMTEQPNEEQGDQDKTEGSEKKPLNIVLLYADDWRHNAIGADPATLVRTPFLDQLAKEGIRFTYNCVTTSVCWISRATLYTGQYVSRHKSDYPQNAAWYNGWQHTFPKLLKDNGYSVAHVGKWHFDTQNSTVYKTFDYWKPYYGFHFTQRNGQKIHITQMNEEDAVHFLSKARDKTKPFMLGVCFFAPHSVDHEEEQFFPQEKSMELYANETVEVPESADAWNKLPYFFDEQRNEARRRWRMRFDTPDKYQHMMKNYYRLISEIDETSSVIYKELEKQGILNETLIIFTTDNGFFHSEHGLAGKWYPHQESIRVPLVIRDPRMPPEKVNTLNDDFTLNIDLATTILGAAQVEPPPGGIMQGRDIADLYLDRKAEPWRTEFFYEHPVHLHTTVIPASSALVRKDYKYMLWPDYQVEQLFDLTSDPLELEDLINKTKHKDLIDEMRSRHSKLAKMAL
eukprot:CAMPEP_0116822146 /NCGR_PEP_ID=MMETSP0418-20121206/105_1 /TAXON_ID=1158023 /ORGANISM="Astrosyne radiata, Strain 13vi08-1A" /LENGTH=700 /DNA_ID=CAMNT_0004450225 /DNA_START=51 /DNA_END=2153 /DNA_ORIENTATION=+